MNLTLKDTIILIRKQNILTKQQILRSVCDSYQNDYQLITNKGNAHTKDCLYRTV